MLRQFGKVAMIHQKVNKKNIYNKCYAPNTYEK